MNNCFIFIVLVLFFFFSLITAHLHAQDYSPLNEGDTAFYTGGNKYVLHIYDLNVYASRIDSVIEIDGKRRYYLNTAWDVSDRRCIKTTGNSWLGRYFEKIAGGIYHFYNANKDTIRINALAQVGEKWNLFNVNDSVYLQAEVIKVSYDSFIGLQDSVKYIELQALDKTGNKLSHILNESVIRISMNYGFVSIFYLDDFPEYGSIFEISGKTKPHAGKTLLSIQDVFNFEIGDMFYYHTSDVDNYKLVSGWLIKEVIYKNYSNEYNQVIYKFKVKEKIKTIPRNHDSLPYETYKEFEKEEAYPLKTIYILPEEPLIDETVQTYYLNMAQWYKIVQDTTWLPSRRRIIPVKEAFEKENDTCWHELITDGPGLPEYMEGCGLYLDDQYYWGLGSITRLGYYKKGSEEWGEPIDTVSVEDFYDVPGFSVYPNPADEFLYITSEFSRPVYIITLAGVKVIETEPGSRVDISTLSPGMYFIKQGSTIKKFIKK